MKTMTAEEWYNSTIDNFTSKELLVTDFDKMEGYSTYLLKHHLEQFSEECKENAEWIKGYRFKYIEQIKIKDILKKYLLTNNIQK